jgi:hypothetical protein
MARALSTRVSALVDSSVSCSGCGRLTLIKTTLSAIPIYTAISIALPPWFLKALRKLMMAFRHGYGSSRQVPCRSRVQRPLHLGVLDLRLFSIALQACWLWLQRMDHSQPWATMRVTEDRQTLAFFSASVHFILGNGKLSFSGLTPGWQEGSM